MYSFRIGAMLESFRLPVPEAIKKASELGVDGLQMFATTGDYAPENITAERKRELLSMTEGCGLSFSALCGDLGMSFDVPERNPSLIEKSKRILDLANELGTNIVTTHVGLIPEDKGDRRYRIMQDACYELCRYADSTGSHFAIETGPEKAETLRDFLEPFGSTGMAVNLDPANFVMVTGTDPVESVRILSKYIVHTHAKDGRKLNDATPAQIFGLVPKTEEQNKTKAFEELPLGQGDVDFDGYLRALDGTGYRGYLTIERECGSDPVHDIALAVNFLREAISR